MWSTSALTTVTTAPTRIVRSPLEVLKVSTPSSCRSRSVAKSWWGMTGTREAMIGSLPVVITAISSMSSSK